MWVFIPALVMMLMYGLGWFLLGVAVEEDGTDGVILLIWLGVNVVFGYPIYLGLVEVAG